MMKDNAIPIRLDTETKERFKKDADELGLSTSALIRILIVSFIREFERTSGRVEMPLNWDISEKSIMPKLLPRRKAAKRAAK